VNYLKELLAFHRELRRQPVSARAMALWYTLMYYSNQAMWRFPVTVSEPELRGSLGLNHDQFIRARRELVEGGYLKHFPQPGNRAAKYTMVKLAKGDIQDGSQV